MVSDSHNMSMDYELEIRSELSNVHVIFGLGAAKRPKAQLRIKIRHKNCE